MPLYVKDAGAWKTVKNIFIKDIGVWKAAKKGWVKNAGIWRQFYSSGFAPITLTGSKNNVNLRNEFDQVYTGQTPTGTVQFIADNALIGSTSTSDYALVTGNWPNNVMLSLTINSNSIIAGAGGRGGNGYGGQFYGENGSAGGPALRLDYNLALNNLGIIGGGGGGGGGGCNFYTYSGGFSFLITSGGGGGAGVPGGVGGICNAPGNSSAYCQGGSAGSTLVGGIGGSYSRNNKNTSGGTGGTLGQGGIYGLPYPNSGAPYFSPSGIGGSAGAAIVRNGYTLTGTTGDVRGAIS